jgi:hypothetical protein
MVLIAPAGLYAASPALPQPEIREAALQVIQHSRASISPIFAFHCYAPNSDQNIAAPGLVAMGQFQKSLNLFDHLIGCGEQRRRNG